MTILYGPIESKVFQSTFLDLFEWLPRLANFVLIYSDTKGHSNIVLLDKKCVLEVFPEFGQLDLKEDVFRSLLKCLVLSDSDNVVHF